MPDENELLSDFESWGAAKRIPIDMLVLTEWNVNEMGKAEFDELVEEIDRGHFDEPCQVVPITTGPNSGKFLVLGGEHRYKACKVIGHKDIPCVVKDHLDPDDEEELMMWSVKRNNVRGKINAQKFAELESRVSKRKKLAVEMARKQMFIRGSMLKSLRKNTSVVENEDDRTDKGGRKKRTRDPAEKRSLARLPTTTKMRNTSSEFVDRQKLLADLRALEQDVLSKCDTIEHGYIFFGQSGHNHLVVEENPHLYKLVSDMAAVCKRESAKINEFLISAISKELKDWG